MSKKALCIGINDYPGTQNDLSGCVNDATDWAAALTAHGFEVTTLLDAQASKAAMVATMGALIAGAAKGDTVVITYSG
ncbi:MAG TPA: caspase family protein, partial [Armatimonadota bacterium]|nr:caspase family protein [Armatimonadota bacterium]